MDSFSVETTFTAADWQAYQAILSRKQQHNSVAAFGDIPDVAGWVLGPRSLTLSLDGITTRRSETTTFIPWSIFQEVEIDRLHLLIWLDRTPPLMLLLRDLPPGVTAEQAATRIREFAVQAGTPGETHPTGLPTLADRQSGDNTTSPTSTPGPRALWRALGFLTLRPRRASLDSPSDWAIAGFTVGSLILWLLLDRLQYGHDAEFAPYDAPGFSWYMLPFLLAAWLVSRLSRPRIEFRGILFLLVVAAPLIIGCSFLLEHGVPPNLTTVVVVALVVYALAYLEIGLRALAGRRQPRAVTTIIVVAILFVSVNSTIYVYPTLWAEPEPETADFQTRAEKAEDLLISQGPRIEAQASRIAATAAGHPGVYFVGFAGVGRQKVFAEEIKLAAQRIATRYDSGQREMLLLNDRRDVESYPLATVAGLRLALKTVAARMDVEQDVLFLALSSHGSADPELSVSNTALSLRDLSGSDLADALHASGIKWKVIVISACHAGAFIDALRDDNTVIFTAAAADRTSFGCSDDRELTYFGEAFYRDALPRSATLAEAFSRAAADIESREQREHVRASHPQAFFGTAMQKKLAEIDSTARCNTGCRQSVPESAPIRSTQRRDHTSL